MTDNKPDCADGVFDVTCFGARPDGSDATAALQATIDACAAQGGGVVRVPGPGVYMTYTLNLKSGVELRIERGATLKGGPDPFKYPEFGPSPHWRPEHAPRFNKRAMFYTVGQRQVSITGDGTIDGNAEAFHSWNPERQRIWRNSDTEITGRCVFFVACRYYRHCRRIGWGQASACPRNGGRADARPSRKVVRYMRQPKP